MNIFKNNKKPGVILSPSKYGGQGLCARTLRQAQGDNAFWSLLVILSCLFLSINASAQSNNTSHKVDSTKLIIRDAPTNPHIKPLIVLNDVIYKNDLKTIDPDSIISVDVLKGNNATAMYGPQAASGVIIIKTKGYVKNKAKPIDSLVSKDALYVIDGQPSKNKLNDVDPNDIFSIDILKKGKGLDSSFEPVNDVIVVVTKANAIRAYEKKLGSVSGKYKAYLETHQNNDNDFLYVVDGIQVQGNRDYITETLYKIPSEKIKEVGFNEKQPTDWSKTLVIINTKQ